jgi:hypothetical protein
MRRLSPFEEKIRHQIRDEMAKKPLITVMAIKEHMEEVFGRGFDYTYIRKLTGKVRTVVIAAWTRGGLLSAATIEKMLPKLLNAVSQKGEPAGDGGAGVGGSTGVGS